MELFIGSCRLIIIKKNYGGGSVYEKKNDNYITGNHICILYGL